MSRGLRFSFLQMGFECYRKGGSANSNSNFGVFQSAFIILELDSPWSLLKFEHFSNIFFCVSPKKNARYSTLLQQLFKSFSMKHSLIAEFLNMKCYVFNIFYTLRTMDM